MATFRPPRAKAALLPLADIPSLTTLYDQGKLSAIEAAAPAAWQPVYAPNPRLNARIALVRHDITRMQVDGIVNAANEALLGGGGVDGAIHRGAGGQLLDACLRLNGCKTGDAKITDGFNLPARKVIHTVGPVYYRMGDKKRAAELLRSCYRRSLEVGAQNGLKSLVFCPIATNIYGYPNEEAAEIAISEVRRYFQEGNGGNYNMVVFTNILDVDYEPYLDVLPKYFPPEPKKEVKAEKAVEAEKGAEEAKGKQNPEEDKAAALTDDEWVKVDESEIPKKASVEDGDEES